MKPHVAMRSPRHSSTYGTEVPALIAMAKRKLEEPPVTEDAGKLVMHPDIPKLVKSMAVVRARAAACKRLVILAELGQKSFIISHGAVSKALAMLEGSEASSSAAVQLLEVLMDPEVRRLCAQPHVAKRLMELCTEPSAGGVLCALLRCEKLCKASGHLAHPAVALLRQGRPLGARVLASLAPHHGARLVEMGALQDLFASLRREERRWGALALRALAAQALCPSALELLEMMRDTEATEDVAARAAAAEALEFLARDVKHRPRLMVDAAVFLRCLDADEPISQQAAAKTLLHLLQTTPDPCTQL